MALDKFYGTSDKEFIDLCPSKHCRYFFDGFEPCFWQKSMVRMWMNDPDGDGWGSPSAESPYFNTEARHSYNVE
jgi:hypothetical protein